jgi:hypothetical protein
MMIGFFPDPYPDELLYSACARYTQITQYPNKQGAVKELFGRKGLAATVDFPNRLDYFVSLLPKGHNYSVEAFIELNTLVPFYAPFLPEGRLQEIHNDMKGEVNNKLQAKLSNKGAQIKNLKYLRYCPVCVKEDFLKYEETYWHRIHQLNGISVCPAHQCFLEDSSIRFGRFSSRFFHNANDSIPKSSKHIRYLDLSRKSHQILLKIAKDAEWLLTNPNLQVNSKILRDRYYNVLLERGFAYYNGNVKRVEFLNACNEFFPDEIFEYVGRFSKRGEWLSALLESGYTKTACHPIRHLLLMTFLGFTAQEFLISFTKFKPFGSPPYPCLNRTSEHYQELRIPECKIFDNLTKWKIDSQPVAVFECDCDFIYQRLGPDKSEEDKFKFNSVREYGIVWESKLIELWADLSISTKEIGEQIGVTKWTVNRHAIRLKLPMNTKDTRSVRGYEKHQNPKATFSKRKLKYREEWLQVQQKYPNATRKDLLNSENFLYLWLQRNDSEWFEEHLPKPIKVNPRIPFLKWEEIDNQLSKEIKKICEEILAIQGTPIRISITEIIRRVGKAKWIDKRHQKLPLTTKVIDEYLESWEDFMIRRITHAKELFIRENVVPTLSRFKIKASLGGSISKNAPKVQEVIQKALTEIKLAVHQK